MTLDRGWSTVIVAASGPSIDQAQADVAIAARDAGRCRVIVVNDTWRLMPTADILYACDNSWWHVHIEAVRAGFKGECWTQDRNAAEKYLLCWINAERGSGISSKPDTIHHAGSSGIQAIDAARLFGAKRIILIGYDTQRTGGKAHFFGDHEQPLSQGNPIRLLKYFGLLAAAFQGLGVEVINASKETALTCWPRQSLEEAFA